MCRGMGIIGVKAALVLLANRSMWEDRSVLGGWLSRICWDGWGWLWRLYGTPELLNQMEELDNLCKVSWLVVLTLRLC